MEKEFSKYSGRPNCHRLIDVLTNSITLGPHSYNFTTYDIFLEASFPNTATLGARASIYEFGWVTNRPYQVDKLNHHHHHHHLHIRQ